MENKCIKGDLLYHHTVLCVHVCLVCLVCMWCVSSSLIKFCVHHSSSLSFPSLLVRKHRRDCIGVGEGQKVKLGSHAGGVFRVSWHLAERFQLIRDPCVYFDGFAGE